VFVRERRGERRREREREREKELGNIPPATRAVTIKETSSAGYTNEGKGATPRPAAVVNEGTHTGTKKHKKREVRSQAELTIRNYSYRERTVKNLRDPTKHHRDSEISGH
jgi:hypothetical protein